MLWWVIFRDVDRIIEWNLKSHVKKHGGSSFTVGPSLSFLYGHNSQHGEKKNHEQKAVKSVPANSISRTAENPTDHATIQKILDPSRIDALIIRSDQIQTGRLRASEFSQVWGCLACCGRALNNKCAKNNDPPTDTNSCRVFSFIMHNDNEAFPFSLQVNRRGKRTQTSLYFKEKSDHHGLR